MKRWIAILPLLALAALGVLFATFALHHDPHVNPEALVGKPLPSDRLPPLAGGAPVALTAEVQGPTLVNVFFSTCAPCEQEHPALLALKAEGARIIGVAYKEDPAKTRAYLERLGDPFSAVLVDRTGRVAIDLGATGAPETYLVNASGLVIAKHVGVIEPKDAVALMEKAQESTQEQTEERTQDRSQERSGVAGR
jgi:cytochrome c biogenesis protein CcmG/thiol:disulfide interchange protein DsbE